MDEEETIGPMERSRGALCFSLCFCGGRGAKTCACSFVAVCRGIVSFGDEYVGLVPYVPYFSFMYRS